MNFMSANKISEAEAEVMEVVWDSGEWIGVPLVHEKLSENRKWAYNTVGTFMNRLCAKGFLESKKEGKTNLYRALISRSEYKNELTREFLDEIHHGSKRSLFAALYGGKLSDEKIDELMDMRDGE